MEDSIYATAFTDANGKPFPKRPGDGEEGPANPIAQGAIMPDNSRSHSRASSWSAALRSSSGPQPTRSTCFRLSHRRRQFRTSAMPAARVLSTLPGAGATLDSSAILGSASFVH